MIIAIDGPAASGKGTIGRNLARHFGLHHLDTGLLYRGVAKALLERAISLANEEEAEKAAGSLNIQELIDNPKELVNYGSSAAVVAGIPSVRTALIQLQRSFAATPPGAVLDGRDIGTVICPDADVKIFVSAAPEVRAQRRASEFRAAGRPVDEAAVLEDIRRRDERDMNRAAAPLRQADDAVLLDTSTLDISAAVRAAIDIVEAVRAGRGRG